MNSSPILEKKFTVPADFEEVECASNETLTTDLLSDHNEAWLIKMPAKISLDCMKDQKIKFHKTTKFQLGESNYTCNATSEAEVSQLEKFNIVLPCAGSKTLKTVPIRIAGQLYITGQNKQTDQIQLEDMELAICPSLPTGLRQRALPFGAVTPKKHKMGDDSVNQSPKKKKKKKDKK